MEITYTRSLNVIHEVDVLVCGAGCAGVGAAIAASRGGASTMVVEQYGFAGGQITAAMVTGCCGLADMRTGELVVGGVVTELLDRTGVIKLPLASRKLFEPVLNEEEIPTHPHKLPIRWEVEKFKRVADQTLLESSVSLLYHTMVVDVASSASRIDQVIVGNKGGVAAIQPKMVIDCTGDADVAAWAGAPWEIGESVEAMTLAFLIGDVKIPPDLYELQKRCATVLEKGRQDKQIAAYGGPWIGSPAPGEIKVNAVRLPFNSASPEELTRAEIQGRQDAWTMFSLWKEHLPEFKEARFMASGPMVGARESRRIKGQYTLTLEDVLHTRRFPDVVVKGAWYVDQHPAHESGAHRHILVAPYDIPYGTLLPQGIENLLVAGRCHSATPEALGSSRVGITAMGMGQAAGTAAALAVKRKVTPAEVNMAELQGELRSQGAILECL